ncbi:MAG: glycerol-3-phosphate acyltransferase [Anaerolineae bacterium]|nr:glycerol-3-phosphate acyltransferase [Anaerolineae bacterium]
MPDFVSLLLWLIVGYLAGSIPAAYIAGRVLKGIDIRDYGSGNVGGANIMAHVSPWAFVPVVATDLLKAILPVWGALSMTGSEWAAMAAGAGAVAGHCWSLYLSFTGGRGMAATLGSLLPLFPLGVAWIVGVHFIGSAFRRAPLADILALASLPVLARLSGQYAAVVWGAVAILLLVAAKRLHANRLPLPNDPASRRQVLLLRLLYDRDVPPGVPWTERKGGIRSGRPSE